MTTTAEKRKISQDRYNQSEKGKANRKICHAHYRKSEKGKATVRRSYLLRKENENNS